MLNRYLSLTVAIVAPASAVAMLAAGAHTVGTVSLADRLPCVGLAIVAAALAFFHLRAAPARATRADTAMWSGLAVFFVAAACMSPHLGPIAHVAALSLAATSTLRLAGGRRSGVSQSPIRRRIFA